MKKRESTGITLIALVITIIILLILAGISIATLTGQNGLVTKANTAKTETEEKSAKEKINLAILGSITEDQHLNIEDFEKEIERLGGIVTEKTEETITVEMDGYEAIIDIKTKKIVKFEPIKGLKPKLDIKQEAKDTIVTITVEVINQVEIVNSITITNLDTGKNLTGIVNGKKGTFDTTLNGFYKVEVNATTEGVQKTTIQTIEVNQIPVTFSKNHGRIDVVWLDINDNIIEKPSEPNLGNMTRVKWEGTTEVELQSNDGWYDYKEKEGKDENLESHWANAKNTDGSYFVWIPRYAYRITYYESETSNKITGYCDGKGIRTVNGEVQQKISDFAKSVEINGKSYLVHPAFRNGTKNNFKNGEWDSELSGIWVGKYESAKNDATAGSVGSGVNIKIVPGVRSWYTAKIFEYYEKSYKYDRSKESHLMKNSEWGAVAYLTQSQYGRNGHEIDINNSGSYITGNGGGSTNAGFTSGITNAYNTTKGAKASTTGNIYGIYDMSGGAREYVASYISNGNRVLSAASGNSFTNTVANIKGYQTLSTKYETVYPYATSENSNNNYKAYKDAMYGYGDAILEISIRGDNQGGNNIRWWEDQLIYPYNSFPFMRRGGDKGDKESAGIFSLIWDGINQAGERGFRVVLMGD